MTLGACVVVGRVLAETVCNGAEVHMGIAGVLDIPPSEAYALAWSAGDGIWGPVQNWGGRVAAWRQGAGWGGPADVRRGEGWREGF